MKALLLFFFSFAFGNCLAQEEIVQSVYFDTNKFQIDELQSKEVVDFIKNNDSTRIESIQIYGYTDDLGKEEYNFKLSTSRANAIQETLLANGITNKIIVTIEGKGRVLIEDDVLENLPEKRSKNRRVDVVLNLKPLPKIVLPGFYTSIQKKHVIGDHIYLENLLFETGSSVLTLAAKTELDKISKVLLRYKNLQFEIQGHVCCTPTFQKEAIDRFTRKRNLSTNRAEAVYKYLVFKKIPKTRMTFKGYGNTVPLKKGAEYDRRVELVISKI